MNKNAILKQLEEDITSSLTISANEIRDLSVDEYRNKIEKKTGFITNFVSRFPLIGRGNVMRNRIQSRKYINRKLDKAIR